MRSGDDTVGGEAELFVDDLVRRGRTEVLQAHTLAELPDELAPAQGDSGLDGDPGSYRWR